MARKRPRACKRARKGGDSVRNAGHPRGRPARPSSPLAFGERDRLKQALIDTGGDKKKAADLLGMSYRTLQRKVKEHDLEGVPRYRE